MWLPKALSYDVDESYSLGVASLGVVLVKSCKAQYFRLASRPLLGGGEGGEVFRVFDLFKTSTNKNNGLTTTGIKKKGLFQNK